MIKKVEVGIHSKGGKARWAGVSKKQRSIIMTKVIKARYETRLDKKKKKLLVFN